MPMVDADEFAGPAGKTVSAEEFAGAGPQPQGRTMSADDFAGGGRVVSADEFANPVAAAPVTPAAIAPPPQKIEAPGLIQTYITDPLKQGLAHPGDTAAQNLSNLGQQYKGTGRALGKLGTSVASGAIGLSANTDPLSLVAPGLAEREHDAANRIREYGQQHFPQSSADDPLVSQGVPMVANLGAAFLYPPAAVPVMGGMAAAQGYSSAKEQGATDAQAVRHAAVEGVPAAAMGLIPGMGSGVKGFAAAAGLGAAGNYVQRQASDLNAKATFDPNREINLAPNSSDAMNALIALALHGATHAVRAAQTDHQNATAPAQPQGVPAEAIHAPEATAAAPTAPVEPAPPAQSPQPAPTGAPGAVAENGSKVAPAPAPEPAPTLEPETPAPLKNTKPNRTAQVQAAIDAGHTDAATIHAEVQKAIPDATLPEVFETLTSGKVKAPPPESPAAGQPAPTLESVVAKVMGGEKLTSAEQAVADQAAQKQRPVTGNPVTEESPAQPPPPQRTEQAPATESPALTPAASGQGEGAKAQPAQTPEPVPTPTVEPFRGEKNLILRNVPDAMAGLMKAAGALRHAKENGYVIARSKVAALREALTRPGAGDHADLLKQLDTLNPDVAKLQAKDERKPVAAAGGEQPSSMVAITKLAREALPPGVANEGSRRLTDTLNLSEAERARQYADFAHDHADQVDGYSGFMARVLNIIGKGELKPSVDGPVGTVRAGDLNAGDVFKLDEHEVEVQHKTEDGHITVEIRRSNRGNYGQDAQQFAIDADKQLPLNRGTLTKAEPSADGGKTTGQQLGLDLPGVPKGALDGGITGSKTGSLFGGAEKPEAAPAAPKSVDEKIAAKFDAKATPTFEEGKAAEKQPWEMTRAEFTDAVRRGRDFSQLGVNPTPLSTIRAAGDMESLSRQAEVHHDAQVATAVAQGKAVPAEVRADYPSLAKAAKQPTRFTLRDGKGNAVSEHLTEAAAQSAKSRLGDTRAKVEGTEPETVAAKPEVATPAAATEPWKSDKPFTADDIERFNRFTHFDKNLETENRSFTEQSKAEADAVRARLDKYGVKDVPEEVQTSLDRLAKARYDWMKTWIRAREVAPPVSVVGPARYNENARPARADAMLEKASLALTEARARVERAVKQQGPKRAISSDAADAPEQLQKKIAEAQRLQEAMVKGNKIVRDKSLTDEQKIEQLKALGLREKNAAEALKPDYMGKLGFPGYALQNNNANIRRMQGRVQELTTRRAGSTQETPFEGGKAVENVEGNRLQVLFDAKPAEDVRAKLKANGFRWAPSEGAWQRQLNDSARGAAERAIGIDFSKAKAVEAATPAEPAESPVLPEFKPPIEDAPATPKPGDTAAAALKSGNIDTAAVNDAAKWLAKNGGAASPVEAAKKLVGEFGKRIGPVAKQVFEAAKDLHKGETGAVPLPFNPDQAVDKTLANVRGLRERFAPIQHMDSPALAKAFTQAVQVGTEGNGIADRWMARAFKDAPPDAAKKFLALGYDIRAKDLQARGMPATGVPALSPADAAKLRAEPWMQRAIASWQKEIAPVVNDIRVRNGLPMSKSLAGADFILNLPSELKPVAGQAESRVNLRAAFDQPAVGEGEYQQNPRQAIRQILRGHLRTDAAAQLQEYIRRDASIDPKAVIDPWARTKPAEALDPSKFPDRPKEHPAFEAPYRGRTEPVEPINLNPDSTGTPDYHYVPKRVASEFNNLYQDRGEFNTLADKIMRGATSAGLVGDFMPHTIRELFTAGGRLAQAGHTPESMIPWLGSPLAAAKRMKAMAGSPIGEAMQVLIDRSGSDRGAGFGIKESNNPILKLVNKPHDWIFNQEHGIDPMARRVVADAHLRTLFGNEAMNGVESDLASGKTTPVEAARDLEAKMTAAEFQGLGRKVNTAMGFANRQTRSSLLNGASRIFPFISSESGMIPNELAKLATLNVNPAALKRSADAGRYGQVFKQVAGMLGAGGVGTYLAMNALNYAATKAENGKGKFLHDNPEGHKLDVQVAPGWYWSNMDPTFSRAMRLSGAQAKLNTGKADTQVQIPNEVLSTLNTGIRASFTGMTGKALHLDPRFKLMQGHPGDVTPLGLGRNVQNYGLSAALGAKQRDTLGAAAAKDAASFGLGVNLKNNQTGSGGSKRREPEGAFP